MDSVSRQGLLQSEGFEHIKEALQLGAEARSVQGKPFDIFKPIRETPLSVMIDRHTPGAFAEGRLNPNLSQVWFSQYGIRIGDMAQTNPYIGGRALHETVSIPNTLSALKIADTILEGAEPYSDWKQYFRLIDMDAPKVNVPITKYTDTVGGAVGAQKGIEIYSEGGEGAPPPIGGKVTTVALDCSGTNNSYRGTLAVNRNDVKDNNFLSVEQSLKNAGNEFYYMIGEKCIRTLVDDGSVPTATKASLALTTPIQEEFEALINVIRAKFPGEQRNRADTMFIHPTDAMTAVRNAGTNGEWPFLSRFILGPTDNTDVVNNSGLAAALGLRNVWETPQIEVGKVLIVKRDIAEVVGLREDLTIENFDLSVGGLYESDLLVRFHPRAAHGDVGAFIINTF